MNDETVSINSGNPDPSDEPKFDLFATEVEDNLKEELAKGTFQWTNKYTKVLGVLLIATALVSSGIWYGHYEDSKTKTTSGSSAFASLRAAFASGGFGGFGGGSGGSTGTTGSSASGSSAGGFGGFGGTRVSATITSIKGSTVTLTLDDPTTASSLTAGDQARLTDSGTVAAPGGASTGGAPSGASTSGSPSGSGTTSAKGSTTTSSASGSAPAAGSGNASGGSGSGSGRAGGLFSNPKLTACLTKAGVKLTAGSRPNFQDPNTITALRTCFTQLGITPGGFGGGGSGGGASGGAAPAPGATK